MKCKASSLVALYLSFATSMFSASCTSDKHQATRQLPKATTEAPKHEPTNESAFMDLDETNAKLLVLNDAVKRNPKSAQAYLRRADYLEKAFEPERAIADYTYAIELEPGNEHAYLGRGRAYCAIERFTDGLADIDRATKSNDKELSIQALKAKLDLDEKLHRYKDAISTYEGLEKLGCELKTWIVWPMPECYARAGQPAMAIKCGNDVVKRWSYSSQSWAARARTYAALGQKEKALSDYNEAIARSTDSAELYKQRSLIEAALGMKSRADTDAALANEYVKKSMSEAPFRH
jgi:tetratricopeptide (TPR) repeat protein